MTPKEKAKELFDKYDKNIVSTNYKHICKQALIQCVLIAVDELINQENQYNNGSFYYSIYWQEVKQEIERL
jgi:hypothetical protein